jgi:hypothetical protein
VLTKNGLYVCHGRYRPKEAAKREVGDSSEMLRLAIVAGTQRDRDFANVRQRKLAAVIEDAALEGQVGAKWEHSGSVFVVRPTSRRCWDELRMP